MKDRVIIKLLKEAGKTGITGKSLNGNIWENAFYAESDILEVCADRIRELQTLPQSDKSGFFEKDGKKWGTIIVWADHLGINRNTLISRLRTFKSDTTKGRNRNGRINKFYSESTVREACASLLEGLPMADEKGFIRQEHEIYGTAEAWSRIFNVTAGAILIKIGKKEVEFIWGIINGQKHKFYTEQTIEKIGYSRKIYPKANEANEIVKNGIVYRTKKGWADFLNVTHKVIDNKFKKLSAKGVKGKSQNGNIHLYYSEDDICEICADLLQDLPCSDDLGFFEKDGIRYGTREALGRLLKVSPASIGNRVKSFDIQSIRGRSKMGGEHDFYPEPAVCEACADLLAKRNPKRP